MPCPCNKTKRTQSRSRVNQSGGSSASAWMPSFYATALQTPSLSAATLAGINNAPVFNPMSSTAVFPTPTSGIIPTGMAYGFSPMVGGSSKKSSRSGTAKRSNKWFDFLKSESQKRGISYKDAMVDSSVKSKYDKIKHTL